MSVLFTPEAYIIIGELLSSTVHGYFSSESALARLGFKTYQREIQYHQEICGEDDWEYFKAHSIAYNEKVIAGQFRTAAFEEIQERGKRSLRKRNDLQNRLSALDGDSQIAARKELMEDPDLMCGDRLTLMELLEYPDILAKRREQDQALAESRQAEMEYFTTDISIEADLKKVSDRFKFVRTALEDATAALGFRYDDTLSSPKRPIVSKPLKKPWRVLLGSLEPDLRASVGPGQVGSWWYQFDIGIIHEDAKTHGWPDLKPGSPAYLTWDLRDFHYAMSHLLPSFGSRSAQELEVSIRMQSAIYSVLQDEIEAALLKGLEKAEEENALSLPSETAKPASVDLDINSPLYGTYLVALIPTAAGDDVMAQILNDSRVGNVDPIGDQFHVVTGAHIFAELEDLPKEAKAEEPLLHTLSRTTPLLVHMHSEDFGWSYILFDRGTIVARFDFQYFEANEASLQHVFSQAELEAFRRMGLDDERIRDLKDLLAPTNIAQAQKENEIPWRLVNGFRKILTIEGLEQM